MGVCGHSPCGARRAPLYSSPDRGKVLVAAGGCVLGGGGEGTNPLVQACRESWCFRD